MQCLCQFEDIVSSFFLVILNYFELLSQVTVRVLQVGWPLIQASDT